MAFPLRAPTARLPLAARRWDPIRRRLRVRSLVLAAFGAIAVAGGLLLYVSAFRATYVDDAYIQLQYARTLLDHQTWGFYAGYPANTATSPLNVLVTAAVGFLVGSVTRAVTVLTALELAAMLGVLLLISRRLFGGVFFGLFAFVALATNPLLLSTIGLESILYALLLVAAVWCFLEERWAAMAVAAGALTVARPDGALLLVILLAFAGTTWRRKACALFAYGATIAPWFLFSWVYLGSFVPDTLVIKLEDTAWGETTFADGFFLYLQRFPLETWASLLLVPFCVLPVWRCGRPVVRVVGVLAAYAVAHALIYAAMGVPPYHWYFTHAVVPLVLIASIAFTCLVTPFRGVADKLLGWATLALPAAGLLLVVWDEGFPFTEAPINSNWATSAQYRAVGEWLDRNLDRSQSVALRGEIGTVAFYSDRYLVNEFSDMSVADALIEQTDYDALPGVGTLLQLNFLWRTDHAPLPAPTYELVAGRAEGEPGCPAGDGACHLARDGATEWVQSRIYVRYLGSAAGDAPPG